MPPFSAGEYLKISGLVTADSRVHVRLGGLTRNPSPHRVEANHQVVAEVLNAEGTLLLRHAIPLSTFCVFPRRVDAFVFADHLPLPTYAAQLRLIRDGVLVHELALSAAGPTVALTWRPSAAMEGRHTITWTGQHAEGRAIRYVLNYRYDDALPWQPISLPMTADHTTIDFDALPGGVQCRLSVTASDGIRTTSVESEPFGVAVKPPIAMIFTPTDGEQYNAEQPILCRGQGFYREERRVETVDLEWTSSRDGVLGRGAIVDVRHLAVGDHEIAMRAGSGSRAARASVRIQIRPREMETLRSDIGR
jgi:hypothetical protein